MRVLRGIFSPVPLAQNQTKLGSVHISRLMTVILILRRMTLSNNFVFRNLLQIPANPPFAKVGN